MSENVDEVGDGQHPWGKMKCIVPQIMSDMVCGQYTIKYCCSVNLVQ